MIIEVPAVRPFTTPTASTEATDGDAEDQGELVAAVPDPVKVVEAPTHALAVPEIVGAALIVTVWVAVHPELFV